MKNSKNTVVIALGGNAILRTGDKGTVEEQYRNIKETVKHLLPFLMREDLNIVITHGNGPQVGNALLRSELSQQAVPPHTLDVCGAETQGSIGYMMAQPLQEALNQAGIKRSVISMVTRTIVDKDDPAFKNPTKFVGLFYSEEEANKLAKEKGWVVKEDSGRGWRRVVPSPIPREILEYRAIEDLTDRGHLVIAVGGGGIPVCEDKGSLIGVEAVIDKDLGSALLAEELGAGLFIILTSVSQVALNFGKDNEKKISKMTLSEAKRYYNEGHFPAGSMGPKILAAIKYLEAIKGRVLITSPESLTSALKNQTGTWITSNS